MKPHFVFYFPYRGAGGVSTLFADLARSFAEQGESVSVCDFPDGFLRKNTSETSVNFIEYTPEQEVLIPDRSLIIFQSMPPWKLPKNIKTGSETRCLFWSLHPFNFVPSLPKILGGESIWNSPLLTKILCRSLYNDASRLTSAFIRELQSKNALAFMDGPNWHVTEMLYHPGVEPNFLPLPISLKSTAKPLSINLKDKEIIKAVWVGRLVNFKYHPLRKSIEDLSSWAQRNDRKIEFHILGSGEFKRKIDEQFKTYKNLKILFIDEIKHSELDLFLSQNFDLALGMGLSALECAKRGIPTLLLDISYRKVINPCYQFVHQTKDFSLGALPFKTSAKSPQEITSMDSIMRQILHSFAEISQKEARYVEEFHGLTENGTTIKTTFLQSEAHFQELQKTYSKIPFFEKIKRKIKKYI